MCGICGSIYLHKKESPSLSSDANLLKRMMDKLRHRGPDDSGSFISPGVSMGHLRLSIIDLTSGRQPIFNENGKVGIVFNGEIYNYKELRIQLLHKGHKFKTNTDTEVLIHLYEEYGFDFLDKLNGIFAFALCDLEKDIFIAARDYFGVKPLHYAILEDKFVFSSEIKALLQCPEIYPEVNHSALHSFLNVRFVPGTMTLFKGINRLGAGQAVVIQNGEINVRTYYKMPQQQVLHETEARRTEQIYETLKKAVNRQLMSDVPLGAYLSGGIDSSSIVALMSHSGIKEINTYCLGFGEPTDELDDAAIAADFFNTKHSAKTVSSEPLKLLPSVLWHVEEPQVNMLQGYLVSKYAAENVKVILSGLGGDELFCGYTINRFTNWAGKIENILPQRLGEIVGKKISGFFTNISLGVKRPEWDQYFRGIQLLCHLWDRPRFYGILRNAWDFQPGMAEKIYSDDWLYSLGSPSSTSQFEKYFFTGPGNFLDQSLANEFHFKMVDDFLLSEDRVSMAHGLESRVPFLDKELVELAFSIPAKFHMNKNQTKYLLKKAMAPHLPKRILAKKKWGFTFDSYYQFQKDLRTTALKILTKRKVESRNIFKYNFIKEILDHPPHPRMRWHYFILWMILGVEVWMQIFIDNKGMDPETRLEAFFD